MARILSSLPGSGLRCVKEPGFDNMLTELGRPLGFLIFSLMALVIRDPTY